MAYTKLPVERQKLPALKVVPKKDVASVKKDMNKTLATIKIMSTEQTNQLSYCIVIVVTEELVICT